MYLLIWRKSCFSFRFRTSRLFLRLQAKHFGSVVKNALYVSIGWVYGKTLFAGRKLCFFYHFRTLGHFSANIPNFCGNRRNSIPSVGIHFDEKFPKKVFSLVCGMEQKDLVFRRRISGRFVKLHSMCPQELFEEKFFSGKSRFFSILFEYWVNFFWPARHKCMLRVQIHFEGKKLFWKKSFLSLSDDERKFFWRSD